MTNRNRSFNASKNLFLFHYCKHTIHASFPVSTFTFKIRTIILTDWPFINNTHVRSASISSRFYSLFKMAVSFNYSASLSYIHNI